MRFLARDPSFVGEVILASRKNMWGEESSGSQTRSLHEGYRFWVSPIVFQRFGALPKGPPKD